MKAEEHQCFADAVETRLRCDFPALRCGVRPHVDTFTEQPIALLIFEVRAVDPPIQLAYSIIGTDVYDESDMQSLVVHVGTLLTRRLHAMSQ